MIRHTVLIACEGAPDDAIETAIAELRALPPLISEIAAYSVGRDLGLAGTTADIVIVAEYATVADYETYGAHPEHVRVVTDHITPIATGVTRGQVEI
ncbi:MAG: Dabb family protein [Actinomycetota bacterium]